MPEEIISHYRIVRKLGQGGMGEVFLANDTRLERPVAIKVLPSEYATDAHRRQRFLTEAKAASALNHPHVCVVHEVGETDDHRPYIVMEFIDGTMLDDRVQKSPLSIREIVSVGIQIADALEAAHRQGVVHRDIKPSNISFNARGQVKVLDFGLAKRSGMTVSDDSAAETQLTTRSGQVMGTPSYMSPEQALGQAVDGRSDLFSLGAVLYELTTGKLPFAGTQLGELLDQIVHAQPVAVARLNYDTPAELERIIRKCLEKDPERRYQGARELRVDLENLRRELEASGGSDTGASKGVEADRPETSLPAPTEAAPTAPTPDELKQSDVFINCAVVDDEPLVAGKPGWTSQLQRNLEVRLEQLSGDKVKIVNLPLPAGPDDSMNVVKDAMPELKAMVSVVSPPFFRSENCRRNVEGFWETAERSGGLWVENKPRLLKVVKTPVTNEDVPPHLAGLFQQLLAFEFYEQDPATGRFREFSEEMGEQARQLYLEKVYDLAFEINQVLASVRKLKHRQPATDRVIPFAGKVVFLAETTSDLRADRDRIKRELQERGYEVVPDRPLPSVVEDISGVLEGYLARADAVIHMVGSRYGVIPEGGEESIVAVQARLTAQYGSRERKGKRFIWRPAVLEVQEERQQQLINAVEEGAFGMDRTELLNGSLEQLKSLVLQHLTAPPPPDPNATRPPEEDDAIKRIYLICDKADEDAVAPLEDYLYEQGMEVKIPAFDGDEDSFESVHREQLKHCDAVIIYYGQASGQWVEIKLMDLLKAPGFGREKPWLAKAVYVAGPPHRRKERFRTRSAEVIRGDAFEPGLLGAFLEKVRGNSGGAS